MRQLSIISHESNAQNASGGLSGSPRSLEDNHFAHEVMASLDNTDQPALLVHSSDTHDSNPSRKSSRNASEVTNNNGNTSINSINNEHAFGDVPNRHAKAKNSTNNNTNNNNSNVLAYQF